MRCFKLISHFKGLLHDQRGWRLLSKWKWTFWECFVMIVTTEKKRLGGWRGTGSQVKAGFFFLVRLCKTKTRLERGISSHSLVCLIRKILKCNWNSNGMESISNGSKECFSIIELNFGLSSRFSVWPWVFVEQWPSFRSRDAAWPHLGAVACGCQYLGGIWSTPTCPVRVRVTSLSLISLLLKCNTFSSSKGKIYPACWTGSWEKWKKSLRLFSVCCGPPGTQVALWQTMALCSVFQELSQIWQLFFMTDIKMICRDTRQREREDSDAVRSCQGVCLFALIVAVDVLGH